MDKFKVPCRQSITDRLCELNTVYLQYGVICSVNQSILITSISRNRLEQQDSLKKNSLWEKTRTNLEQDI